MQVEDTGVVLARHDERISDLERWQKEQNCRLARVEEKLDRLHFWLIGTLGGVIASLVLLIVNLVSRRG